MSNTWEIYVLERKIKNIQDYRKAIIEPFILSVGTLENTMFKIPYTDFEYDHQREIRNFFSKLVNNENIWEVIKTVCNEDVEWTTKRNKDLTGIFYRKYTLKEEYITEVETYLNELEQKYITKKQYLEIEEQKEKQERQKRKEQYIIAKVYKNIISKGGEEGQDGYYDVNLKNTVTGEITRVVERNVFDFGHYIYPKRVEGTEVVFKDEQWTEEEKFACNWINEFSSMEKDIKM